MCDCYKLLKSNGNIILNCNYDQFLFYPTFKSAPSFCDGPYIRYTLILIGVILFLFIYYAFESSFTPCVDIVNKILTMQTIGQIVELTLI